MRERLLEEVHLSGDCRPRVHPSSARRALDRREAPTGRRSSRATPSIARRRRRRGTRGGPARGGRPAVHEGRLPDDCSCRVEELDVVDDLFDLVGDRTPTRIRTCSAQSASAAPSSTLIRLRPSAPTSIAYTNASSIAGPRRVLVVGRRPGWLMARRQSLDRIGGLDDDRRSRRGIHPATGNGASVVARPQRSERTADRSTRRTDPVNSGPHAGDATSQNPQPRRADRSRHDRRFDAGSGERRVTTDQCDHRPS